MNPTENNQQPAPSEQMPAQTSPATSTEPPKGILTYYKVLRVLMIIATLFIAFFTLMVFTRWEDMSQDINLTKNQTIGALVFMAFYIPFIFYVLGQIKKGKKWAILTITVLYGLSVITSLTEPGSSLVVSAALFVYSLTTYTQNKTYFR